MPPVLTKRWIVPPPPPEEIESALAEYPAVFRRVLYNRGVSDMECARRFLEARPSELSPFLLAGMHAAVDRILWAADHGEKIAVYGDYDVDGVTATALLLEVLSGLGADVIWHIPNRFDEGYGLNNEALDLLAQQDVDLIITVDCGIRSPAEAEHARTLGMDMIISDHHHPGAELPVVAAVINPKQESDPYPDKDLSGVGLAFKIAQALLLQRPLTGVNAEDWLDLVALGTISDVVPLTGENRALVRAGLERLRAGRRQGVVSLAGAAGVKLAQLSAGDVGFMLGPRLNAAGRLDPLKLRSACCWSATSCLPAHWLSAWISKTATGRSSREQRRNKLTASRLKEGTVISSSPSPRTSIPVLSAWLPPAWSKATIARRSLGRSRLRPPEHPAAASPNFTSPTRSTAAKICSCATAGTASPLDLPSVLKILDELQRRLTEIAREELQDKDLVPTLKGRRRSEPGGNFTR